MLYLSLLFLKILFDFIKCKKATLCFFDHEQAQKDQKHLNRYSL